jgi:hypothetical protein
MQRRPILHSSYDSVKTMPRRRTKYNYINPVLHVLLITIMAPVGQEILETCEEKSSKPFGSKMRQLSLEINQSSSSTERVHGHLRVFPIPSQEGLGPSQVGLGHSPFFKHLRSPGIDFARLCSLTSRYVK